VYLVKSVFRVSSLIFFGFRHEECRPVVCFTGCPSCRT
ncbi:PrgI family protein, partial [Bifidobacterium longum]